MRPVPPRVAQALRDTGIAPADPADRLLLTYIV